jgi:hypothetical protein
MIAQGGRGDLSLKVQSMPGGWKEPQTILKLTAPPGELPMCAEWNVRSDAGG